MKKEKVISKRKQLQEKIYELSRLYYYLPVRYEDDLRVNYKIAGLKPYLTLLATSVMVMIVFCFFKYGEPPLPLSLVEMPFISAAVTVAWDELRDCYYTKSSLHKGTYVTFHVCRDKQIQRVQETIDAVNAEITRLQAAEQAKQEEKKRSDFAAKLEVAEAVNPEFKELFKIIENDLGGTVAKTLSENNYGLTEDVIMEADVRNILSYMDVTIPKGLCLSPFELNSGQLRAWTIYVSMLRSFQKEYSDVCDLLAKAKTK